MVAGAVAGLAGQTQPNALAARVQVLEDRDAIRALLVSYASTLDNRDFATTFIFGDAASATILYGEAGLAGCRLRLSRPELAAEGEPGRYLRVPASGSGDPIYMDGVRVFSAAVRRMTTALKRACESHQLTVADLDLIIAHQANQRILDAIGHRLKLPPERLYSNVRNFGNTSSSTIPVCLSEVFPEVRSGQRIGLAAFGGGFTFGAALLEGL